MEITKNWLIENDAWDEVIDAFRDRQDIDSIKLLESLMDENELECANWLIIRLMTREQQTQFALFATCRVLSVLEKELPGCQKPTEVIEAIKKFVIHPSEENLKMLRQQRSYIDDLMDDAWDEVFYAASAIDTMIEAVLNDSQAEDFEAVIHEVCETVDEPFDEILNFGIKLLKEGAK